LKEIVSRTTASISPTAEKAADGAKIREIQLGVREILVSEDVLDYAVRLIMMTHPDETDAPETVKKYVRFGSGPRGIQAIISVAKVRALCAGRLHVSINDIQQSALPALRHRLFLNFEGQALGISTDSAIEEIIQALEQKR